MQSGQRSSVKGYVFMDIKLQSCLKHQILTGVKTPEVVLMGYNVTCKNGNYYTAIFPANYREQSFQHLNLTVSLVETTPTRGVSFRFLHKCGISRQSPHLETSF